MPAGDPPPRRPDGPGRDRHRLRRHRARRLGHLGSTLGFIAGLILVLGTAVTAPLAIVSAVRTIHSPDEGEPTQVTVLAPGTSDFSRIQMHLVRINEVDREATLRVSAFHVCEGECDHHDRLLFATWRPNARQSNSVPARTTLDLPAGDVEVERDIVLPLQGSVMLYPFDRYRLRIGVAVMRLPGAADTAGPPDAAAAGSGAAAQGAAAQGTAAQGTAAQGTAALGAARPAGDPLQIWIDSDAPRLLASAPVTVDAAAVTPALARVPFSDAFSITLTRPLYLKVLVVLLVALLAVAAIYLVALRSFTELIVSLGGVILGLWGARGLLLGGFPPDVTVIDLVISATIILILVIMAARSLGFFHTLRMAFRAAAGGDAAEPEEQAPEGDEEDGETRP